jgi:ribosomal protein S18 acetylase RimI-like enzyme
MMEGNSLQIRTLSEEQLDDVVRIHLAGLGYTFNSCLGQGHMRFLYRSMREDPACYVGVAKLGERTAGVVSGSIDAGEFSARLFRAMSKRQVASIAWRMLVQPRLIWAWLQTVAIAAPVRISSTEVRAVLTAIAVDAEIQGKGIGRALVGAFEAFLREHGVRAYKLDTRLQNERALRFYAELGFERAARRADSVVFVRRLCG